MDGASFGERGEGGVEGLLFVCFRKFRSSFERLPAPELLFSCVAKRKVTQREGHPAAALAGHPARQVREPWPGFSAGLPARSKRHRPPWRCPLRGLVVHGSPPPRGPGKAGALPARQKQQQQRSPASLQAVAPSPACRGGGWGALDLAVASARWERAALPGAPMARRVGGGKVLRMARRDAGQFFAGTGCAVEKPRSPPAHPQGRRPGGRAIGVPFLFGSFLFGHAKRKELGPRQRLRNCSDPRELAGQLFASCKAKRTA
jgi:hypothetical protein